MKSKLQDEITLHLNVRSRIGWTKSVCYLSLGKMTREKEWGCFEWVEGGRGVF